MGPNAPVMVIMSFCCLVSTVAIASLAPDANSLAVAAGGLVLGLIFTFPVTFVAGVLGRPLTAAYGALRERCRVRVPRKP